MQPMELAHLPFRKKTFEDYVGEAALERRGKKRWREDVADVVATLSAALSPTTSCSAAATHEAEGAAAERAARRQRERVRRRVQALGSGRARADRPLMPAVSHICQAYPDRVEVRGRDLCGDLMGRLSFTEYFHLLLTGREPTEEQRYFLDLLLVAIAEHGMMPTNVAARMTLAADPGSLQGALAAGILGAGR